MSRPSDNHEALRLYKTGCYLVGPGGAASSEASPNACCVCDTRRTDAEFHGLSRAVSDGSDGPARLRVDELEGRLPYAEAGCIRSGAVCWRVLLCQAVLQIAGRTDATEFPPCDPHHADDYDDHNFLSLPCPS